MDFKRILFATVHLLLTVSCLAIPADRLCGVGFLWDSIKQTCVQCFDVCQDPRHARALSCLKRCFDTSKTLNALYLKRHRRDINNSCNDVTCPSGSYCDVAIGGRCSPCSVICDSSHIQGTTKQCYSLCAGYVTASRKTTKTTSVPTTTTTTTKPRTPKTEADNALPPFLLPMISTILIILLVMGIIGLGYLCYRKWGRILRLCRKEEKKMSVPCSQESELGYIDSQTPLTISHGPIREAQNAPIAATGDPLMRNLGEEMGYPEVQCPYTELDRPDTPSTALKRIMVNEI